MNDNPNNKTHVNICKSCGKNFLVVRWPNNKSKEHVYCSICWKKHLEQKEKEKQEHESKKWAEKRKQDQLIFNGKLASWDLEELSEIKPTPGKTLYIIGNGFDLMHGVESSYYSFRDSLGKHSDIRDTLEIYWTPEDIWADFEEGLAHFDANFMAGRDNVDMYLDDFGAFDEDASRADYFAAIDSAAWPLEEVSRELPKRFRRWVEQLSVQTSDRPLKSLFVEGKVLDFNYTEFVEDLYDVPYADVCYIHGCRRKLFGKPKEKLILGHGFGASDDSYVLNQRDRKPKTYRQALIDMAQERVLNSISNWDEELTKNTGDIIKAHEGFFQDLRGTKDIVVIGHSLSVVDAPYFQKIVEVVGKGDVHWHIGVHGLRDLKNLEGLMEALEVSKDDISIFRTDIIHVTKTQKDNVQPNSTPKVRILDTSKDGLWRAKKSHPELSIERVEDEKVSYQVIYPNGLRKAFFDSSGERLFMIEGHSTIYLFAIINGEWQFVCAYLDVLNNRLRKVFMNSDTITFVYNNRVTQYSLIDGKTITNKQLEKAPQNWMTTDEDITDLVFGD